MVHKIQVYVTQLMSEMDSARYSYHNRLHVERVVKSVTKIAKEEEVDDRDLEILKIAAWFHDVGYIEFPEKHEEHSAELAEAFLKKNNYDADKIEQISSLIMATKQGHVPANQLEKIIADADLSHIGSKKYLSIADDLRHELSEVAQKEHSDLEWLQVNLAFLQKHQFRTLSAQDLYSEQKKINMKEVKKMISEIQEKEEKKAKRLKLEMVPEKGKETAYRIALKNHMQLSKIADNKANIMLSVSALMLSIVITAVLPNATDEVHHVVPVVLITLTCLLAIIFATIATRPKVTSGLATKKEIEDKRTNLLFFGNFHSMDFETYQWGMEKMMNDREYLYSSLNKDLFFLGVVLHRKFKYLRLTYNIFMTGIVLSALAFLISNFCI